ncbi:lipopolysaccharide-binding protein-like isoform X6 [Heterocephalus glaber]|uniref:Bactericidal permeability-increasing protein n=1 Tax=Heterocephalus glaber TaxID=10181 RepID=A0AAX6S1A2_HETGA|nr:lipopolysaccharide-binding protein-like isoform X6 [Heterocephalus glaber]
MIFTDSPLDCFPLANLHQKPVAKRSGKCSLHSLKIYHFNLQNWDLSLLPELGIRVSLSSNYMSIGGNWKVNKAFITLQGTFDMKVYGISISVSLNLGKDQSGHPTSLVTQCSNSIGHVSIDISGSLSWILNLFHEIIENNIKMVLEQKICEMVRKSTTSYLEPYLRTLPGCSHCNETLDCILGLSSSGSTQLCLSLLREQIFGGN